MAAGSELDEEGLASPVAFSEEGEGPAGTGFVAIECRFV